MKKCPYCSNPNEDSSKRCMFCGRNLDLELAKKLEKQKADRERFKIALKIAFLAIVITAGTVATVIWAAIYSPIGSIAKQSATQTAEAVNICDPEEVSKAAHQLIDYNDRWADIMALAVHVDQSSVVIQVDRLQKIRRDAKDVIAPLCLREAKNSLLDGMEDHINGLLKYIQEGPTEEVKNFLTKGNLEMNTFADEVERLQKCAPDCR